MSEREEIFRNRLVALLTDLNGGDNKDPQLRRTVGGLANKIFRDAGARSWSDLKERADAATYDSLLRLFRQQSEEASKQGDSTRIKAIELLAISMIARTRNMTDLQPGVQYLDGFIAECNRQAAPGRVQRPRPAER